MNEFTKEELIDLYYAIRYFWKNRAYRDLPSDTETCSHSYDLMEKIDSLIDNYCEHDWQEIFNERTYSRCNKCGEEEI